MKQSKMFSVGSRTDTIWIILNGSKIDPIREFGNTLTVILHFSLEAFLFFKHLDANPALTSAWEISAVMEEPILPFITLPPPVIVPGIQEEDQVNILEE